MKPEEETSQESTEETSPEGESEETSTQEESAVATEESQEDSQAELKRLRQVETDYKALEPKFTQTSQENASYKAYYEQQQAQAQQQADPLEALYTAQAEANNIGDTAAAAQTQRKIDDIRQQQMTYQAAHAAMQATAVQQNMSSAESMMGGQFTLQDFQNVKGDMTPEEAAIIKRHRAGTLGEVFKEQRQERSAAARAAQSGARGRARGPRASMPEEETSSVVFNPKMAISFGGNKKALKTYIESCDPETVHPDFVD